MRKEGNQDKARAFPKWVCQKCHHSLTIVGVDSYAAEFLTDSLTPQQCNSLQSTELTVFFANSKGSREQHSTREMLQTPPFKIENDKVDTYSVTQSFNRLFALSCISSWFLVRQARRSWL
ncbi:uncharacterized protein LOC106363655 isoform X1 [Brassica napus]|uniref:uncharacterized protein LOC106363655 isoform X1 n=1 Tax=Brassica napus TaxID=3708 RepID=UPI000BBED2ED|nr:uncharacterized protein LOC106363655 isoform X1 [Brassica napus]